MPYYFGFRQVRLQYDCGDGSGFGPSGPVQTTPRVKPQKIIGRTAKLPTQP